MVKTASLTGGEPGRASCTGGAGLARPTKPNGPHCEARARFAQGERRPLRAAPEDELSTPAPGARCCQEPFSHMLKIHDLFFQGRELPTSLSIMPRPYDSGVVASGISQNRDPRLVALDKLGKTLSSPAEYL